MKEHGRLLGLNSASRNRRSRAFTRLQASLIRLDSFSNLEGRMLENNVPFHFSYR